MTNITQVSTALENVLGTKADNLARETKFVQREVKITGSKFAQTLVFGFLDNPKMSYREMSQAASLSGLGITAQGLEQKFSQTSAKFMQALLEKAVEQLVDTSFSVDIDLLNRFSRIYIQDGSVMGLPDECVEVWQGVRSKARKGCSALKMHVSLDYKSGKLSGPTLANGREHDRKSPWFCTPLEKGELRLTDLGFFDLDQMKKDANSGGFWVVRYKHGVILRQNDQEMALLAFLKKQASSRIDIPVQLGQHHHIPCRLIAVKVDDQVAEKRRRKLHEYARRKGVALSEERLQFEHWTLLLTNAPPDLLSLVEVCALYRLRWQIELLFRLWKTYTLIDESVSKNPWRILTEMYAKLIAVLIQHWLIIVSIWHIPEKSIVQASLTIQKFAVLLHLAMANESALCSSISTIITTLKSSPAVLLRKKQPATFQILSDPNLSLC
jgi:hypothetical protein